jgi:hypothetical protein
VAPLSQSRTHCFTSPTDQQTGSRDQHVRFVYATSGRRLTLGGHSDSNVTGNRKYPHHFVVTKHDTDVADSQGGQWDVTKVSNVVYLRPHCADCISAR